MKLDKYIENDQLNFDLLVTDLIGINEDSLQVKTVLEFLFEQLNKFVWSLLQNASRLHFGKLSAYKEEPVRFEVFWPKILKRLRNFFAKRIKMLDKESLTLTSILPVELLNLIV